MRTKRPLRSHPEVNSLGWEDKAWIDQELDGAYFQDVRLGKRLRTLLGLMSNGLGQTIPLACQDWANTKAANRFSSNSRISEEEILSSHFASTRTHANTLKEPLLVLHDTTEFSYYTENKDIGLLTRPYDRRPPVGAGGHQVLDAQIFQRRQCAQAQDQSNANSDRGEGKFPLAGKSSPIDGLAPATL